MILKHQRMIVISALVSVFVLGAWLHAYAIVSRYQQIEALRDEARGLSLQIGQGLRAHQVEDLRDKVRAAREREVSDLLTELTDDLDTMDIHERSFTMGSSSRTEYVQATPLSLNFRSSFPTAFELIQRLGAYRPLVRTQKLTIVKEALDAAGGVSVLIQMSIYTNEGSE